MNRSKIEWVDHEWNPITGCTENCKKCAYNRFILGFGGADYRFNLSKVDMYQMGDDLMILNNEFILETGHRSDYPFGLLPTYHRYRLNRLGVLSTGKNVLCGSIGEMFGYDESWCYEEIFNTCRHYFQNNYLFLSSNPAGYVGLQSLLPTEDNMWYGSVIYSTEDYIYTSGEHNCFIYANPKEDLAGHLLDLDIRADWLIVGISGCRYGDKKQLPEKQWIDNLIEYAQGLNIPVFIESGICIGYQQPLKKDYPDQLMWKSGRRYFGEIREKMVGVCCRCKQEELKQRMIAISGCTRRREQKLMGYLCRTCFQKACTDYGLKNILGGTENG